MRVHLTRPRWSQFVLAFYVVAMTAARSQATETPTDSRTRAGSSSQPQHAQKAGASQKIDDSATASPTASRWKRLWNTVRPTRPRWQNAVEARSPRIGSVVRGQVAAS